MRMKVSRGRGRPSGKHRTLADFRILQYLALISTKYGVGADEFFNSLVAAWKHQPSTCKNLMIECRKQTRENAVFLLTNSRGIVAQFPIPTHILEGTNPLKDLERGRA